jgi:hypothetical protein
MLISAPLLYNRSHSTMARHLWILGKLLTMTRLSASANDETFRDNSARLLRYVAATCYPKMIRRLNHKTLSLPLIEALKQIQTFTFNESKLDQERNEGTEIDILFLTNFLPLAVAAKWLTTPIPKIMEKANVPMDNDRSAFRLYTQDTCVEFHNLLMELLLCFQSSLGALRESYRKNSTLTVSAPSCQDIKDNVECVVIYGYALHRLTKGAALPMHLKNIAHLLRSLNLGRKITMPTPAPGEEQEEPDEELKAVQPFVLVNGIETPVWQSYLDWLRLMVAHFDATDILITYVKGPSFIHHAISIQVLVAPPVDQRLLTLKELLDDPTLFPTMTESQANIPNAEILEFLNNGFLSSSLVKGIKKRWRRSITGPTKKDVNEIKSALVNLKSSCWSESATKLLKTFENSVIPPTLESEEFSKISEDIDSLWASCMFFASLDAARKKFTGTLHCEACLASLLDETATFNGDILAQMKVGMHHKLVLIIRVSFLLKGFWTNYWNIKTLLPSVSSSTLPPVHRREAIRRKRPSQYRYSLHSPRMASLEHCGFNEQSFRGPVETGAC